MGSEARKLVSISEAKKEPEFKDGDDDGSDTSLLMFTVEVATNGFVLTFQFDDGTELKEIHEKIDDVFKSIKAAV